MRGGNKSGLIKSADLLAVTLCTAIFLLMFRGQLSDFLLEETGTLIKFVEVRELPFPAVSICSVNKIEEHRMDQSLDKMREEND